MRGRPRTTTDHGPMLEAECVRVVCTDGAVAAAAHVGVTVQTARRWAAQWGVPPNPPAPSAHTVAVAVRAIIAQFAPTKETTP